MALILDNVSNTPGIRPEVLHPRRGALHGHIHQYLTVRQQSFWLRNSCVIICLNKLVKITINNSYKFNVSTSSRLCLILFQAYRHAHDSIIACSAWNLSQEPWAPLEAPPLLFAIVMAYQHFQFLCKTLLLIDSNISLTFQSETIPHLLPITMASQMLRDLSVNLVSPHHHTHTMSHETTSSALFDVRDRGTQFLVCPNGHIHHSPVVVTFLITKDFIWASLLWINVICSLLTLWLTHCDWY